MIVNIPIPTDLVKRYGYTLTTSGGAFTVPHGVYTEDMIVQVWEILPGGKRTPVAVDMQASAGTVVLNFPSPVNPLDPTATPIPAKTYRVVVMG